MTKRVCCAVKGDFPQIRGESDNTDVRGGPSSFKHGGYVLCDVLDMVSLSLSTLEYSDFPASRLLFTSSTFSHLFEIGK